MPDLSRDARKSDDIGVYGNPPFKPVVGLPDVRVAAAMEAIAFELGLIRGLLARRMPSGG